MDSTVLQADGLRGGKVGSVGSATVRYMASRVPAATATLLVMWLLKSFYSTAGAADLDWILAPTAWLVSLTTPAKLIAESGIGYADYSMGIIVAPACAGLNFMIMVFGLAAVQGIHRIDRLPLQLLWLALALVCAYVLTLPVNSIRIFLSMELYRSEIYSGWITVQRVHRIAGTALYFGALWGCFLGSRWLSARFCRLWALQPAGKQGDVPEWVVPALYLLVTLGIPLARGMWKGGSPWFAEHSVTVAAITVVLAAGFLWLERGSGRQRPPVQETHTN